MYVKKFILGIVIVTFLAAAARAQNQLPVLDLIGPQSTTEGVNLNLGVTASDAESTPALTTTVPLPSGASFIDNGNGTGTFSWTPDFTQSGPYNVTFYATDDSSAVDSEIVTITVIEGGNYPDLNPIGSQSTTEGVLLSFGVSATDVDGDSLILSTSTLPAGASFVDYGDGSGLFDWAPNFLQSGTHFVTFYASDGVLVDSEVVQISVTEAGNQPPVLAAIGAKSTFEGVTLNFGVSATDGESIPALTTSGLPSGASFVDNGNGTGTFGWTPDFTQGGTYDVTFYATDDSAAVDSEIITITVTESGNQPPVIVPINDTTVSESQTLVINVSATDPDGNPIILTVSTSMNHYTFMDNGNGTGVFTYQADYTDAGVDTVRFFATDNGFPQLSDVELVVITTIDVNQPPQFEPAGPFAVEVNDTLIFTVVAIDPTDSSSTARLFLTVSGAPVHSQFVDNGDNSGTFTFMPDSTQVGVDTVTFLAIDQGVPALTGNLPVEITVVSINFPPVLDSIGPKQVLEGDTLIVNLSASDPDGPYLMLQVTNAPLNSNLTDNGDGTGVFTFTPSFVQSGLYYVTFKAFDGIDIDKEVVLIQVLEAGNQAPVFDSIPSLSVVEGDTLIDIVMAHDPEMLPVTITFDSATMPANFSYVDSGNGVASFIFTPDYCQSDTYYVDVIVSDGSLADTATMTVEVIEAGNQLPTLDSIPDQTVVESHTLSFTVTATDPDCTKPLLQITNKPAGASFPASAYGSAVFNWVTDWDDSGTYVVTFYAIDSLFPDVIDSQLMTITVVDSNRAPYVFVPEMPETLWEGDTLSFIVIAWDQDGPTPTIEAFLSGTDILATNMTFDDSANGHGLFTFAPDYTQGDENPTWYQVVFRTCDSAEPTLCNQTHEGQNAIRVYNANQPPVMIFSAGTGPFNITQGDSLVFSVVATDPEGPPPTLDTANLPANATWQRGAQNFGTFRFYPSYVQAGQYFPKFIATDNQGLADTQIVEINVAEAGNQRPYFTTVLLDTIQVFVGVPVITDLEAVDPDLDLMTLTASRILSGASFDTSSTPGNIQGVYNYDPDPGDIDSVFQVMFIATDPLAAADTIITHYHVKSFLRGDTDSDYKYTMNDIVYLLNYLFRDGPEPVPLKSGDVDDSGDVNVSDIAYLVNYLYKSGPRPPQ